MGRLALIAGTAALIALPSLAEDLVATRSLRVGTVLAPDDVRVEGGGEASDERIAEVVGLEVRRSVYNGRPIDPDDLGPPTLIRRNDLVIMTYAMGGLGIRTEGRALSSGGEGELIQVMNLTSRLTVSGIVRGTRLVEVSR